MRVLFLTNLPTPYRVDFYNALSRYCHLTVSFEGRRFGQQKFNWIDERQFLFEYHFASEWLNERRIKWKMIWHALCGRYDKIVIGCYHTPTQSLLDLLLKLFRKEYVFETDGGIVPANENIFKTISKRMLIGGASLYLSPSKSTDDYLMHYGALRGNIYRYPFTSIRACDVIKNILTDEQKRVIRKKLGIYTPHLVLGVGQFIHRKGFDILLKAMANVQVDTMLCLVGGTATEEYNAIIKKYNLSNVIFRPFLTKKELTEYYKASDLFVLPTREDIWGLVINEAMAQGLPVITTDKCVAGIELVSDKELIVPADNDADLSKAIRFVLDNASERQIIAHHNLDKIRNYTTESMADAIFKAIEA